MIYRLRAKELTADHEVSHWTGCALEWHRVVSVSGARRRHGDEGDWVYDVRLEAPDGHRWTSVVPARHRLEAREQEVAR